MLRNHTTHSRSTQLTLNFPLTTRRRQSKQRRRKPQQQGKTPTTVCSGVTEETKSIQRAGKAETPQILAVPVLFKFYLKDLQWMV